MHRLGLGSLILALACVGCGESGPTEGPVEFKAGNIDQLGPLQNQMMESMKSKSYLKKGEEPKAKAGMPKGAMPKGATGKVETPASETPK